MSKLWSVELEKTVTVVVWADSKCEAEFLALRSEYEIFSENEAEMDATVLREITEDRHLPNLEWLDCYAYGEREEIIRELLDEIEQRPTRDTHTIDMFQGQPA